jgi:hypothetical protein
VILYCGGSFESYFEISGFKYFGYSSGVSTYVRKGTNNILITHRMLTYKIKVTDAKFVSAGLSTHLKEVSGHPRVSNSDQESVLVSRLLHLERIGLGQTADQVRRATYSLAEANSLKHPWDCEKKIDGVDWLRAFMKRNTNLSLRKHEGLSRGRAEGLIKGEVAAYFNLLATVLEEHNLLDKPHKVHNMDESGFPLNNRPQKIISAKGKWEVVSLTNVEIGENETVVACFNATGTYVPPMIIFKGIRKMPQFQDGLLPGSVV